MSYTRNSVLTESPPTKHEPERALSPRTDTTQIEKTLGIASPGTRSRRLRWFLIASLLLIVVVLITWWINAGSSTPIRYQTGEVVRGDLTLTVTATGNLEAVNTVEVGSEISGLVERVYVDFNDRVERGQVIAALNIDRLDAEVKLSQASFTAAEAAYEQAVATLNEKQKIATRAEKLAEQEFISAQELESNHASFIRARAAVASAYAQIEVADANLDVALTNLSKGKIHSPIDGIVLSRNIEPGQTVAAAFQTPVLFLLAEDLTKMELQVDVDEADVGNVEEGQIATFTVDAHPDRVFPAEITSLHYASQTVGGVVTYKAELSVDNQDLLLRPGMTATAEITTQTVKNALLVPNSALRFTPPDYTNDPSLGERVVWTLRDNDPVAIPVTTGPSNGLKTVIYDGEITPDMQLLINVASDDESSQGKGTKAVKAVHPS